MHDRVLAAGVALLSAVAATARAQDTAAVRDECTAHGRAIAAFAARAYGWTERAPSATRHLALGRGDVWVVDENPACCPRVVRRPGSRVLALAGCSVRSETRTAHVGEVGARRFALARSVPELELAAAGENLLAAPWRAEAWSAFLRAARAAPRTEREALAIAMHVHASLFHGLGVLGDQGAAAVVAAAAGNGRDALARAMAQAARRGLEVVESRAVRTSDGFDVTLWSSRHAPATSALDPGIGPGAVLSEELRRTRLMIADDGTVDVVEIVAAESNVQRVIAR